MEALTVKDGCVSAQLGLRHSVKGCKGWSHTNVMAIKAKLVFASPRSTWIEPRCWDQFRGNKSVWDHAVAAWGSVSLILGDLETCQDLWSCDEVLYPLTFCRTATESSQGHGGSAPNAAMKSFLGFGIGPWGSDSGNLDSYPRPERLNSSYSFFFIPGFFYGTCEGKPIGFRFFMVFSNCWDTVTQAFALGCSPRAPTHGEAIVCWDDSERIGAEHFMVS